METIEKVRILYKNIIRVGKELDAERFRAELESRGFKTETRIVPTPTGPLKEYLLREPKLLRDLIVVSTKGFVIDAHDYESALELISIGYEVYEMILGDLIKHTLVDIIGDYQLIVLINKNSLEIMRKHLDPKLLEKMQKSLKRDIIPFSIGFAWGKPVAPNEWVVVTLAPIIAPSPILESNRLQIRIQYRHVNPDAGVEFLQKLRKIVDNIVKTIL